MNMYVNCKLINILIYINQNRFLFYFISDVLFTEYPVGSVSFLLFEYNTHFSCPPPLKNVKGGGKGVMQGKSIVVVYTLCTY